MVGKVLAIGLIILSVVIFSLAHAEDVLEPARVPHDFSVLDIKIGDTLSNVKNAIDAFAKEKGYSLSYKEEVVSYGGGRKDVNVLNARLEEKKDSSGVIPTIEEISIAFSDPAVGNRVIGIQRNHLAVKKKVLADSFIKAILEKYGTPTQGGFCPRNSVQCDMIWRYGTDGKQVVKESGANMSLYSFQKGSPCTGNNDRDMIKCLDNQAKGAPVLGLPATTNRPISILARVTVDIQNGFVSSVRQMVRAPDFSVKSKRKSFMEYQAVMQQQLNKQQDAAGQNKLKF